MLKGMYFKGLWQNVDYKTDETLMYRKQFCEVLSFKV